MMIAPEILRKISDLVLATLKLLYFYVESFYHLIIPPPMKSIDGEAILVTGAVGGIGKEICRHIILSGRNIKLVLCDLDKASLRDFTEELEVLGEGKGLKLFPCAVDISSREKIEECCKKVKARVGPISIIFNNAGIFETGNFLMLSNEQIERTIQVNLMSHFWIIRQLLPEMLSRNHGRIVNICSIGGLKGGQNASAYFASKFGVNGYSEALKMELQLYKNDGIHVTMVYPWLVRTPLISSLEVRKNTSAMMPSVFETIQSPEAVGRKVVEGMRMEYEYIFLPSIMPVILFAEYLVPVKFTRFCNSLFLNLFQYKDEAERERLSTPLHPVTVNGNGEVGEHHHRTL